MIDTVNKHMVTSHGDKVLVMMPARQLTPEEAMVFAAWLVTMAEVATTKPMPEFQDYLNAVQNA